MDRDLVEQAQRGDRDSPSWPERGATRSVSILDVAGRRLTVAVISYEETAAADLSAAGGILTSLVIRP